MADQEETDVGTDEDAAERALEVIGPDVFGLLADASHRYGVVISVHIAPNRAADDPDVD